jgi:hypothetical protein
VHCCCWHWLWTPCLRVCGKGERRVRCSSEDTLLFRCCSAPRVLVWATGMHDFAFGGGRPAKRNCRSWQLAATRRLPFPSRGQRRENDGAGLQSSVSSPSPRSPYRSLAHPSLTPVLPPAVDGAKRPRRRTGSQAWQQNGRSHLQEGCNKGGGSQSRMGWALPGLRAACMRSLPCSYRFFSFLQQLPHAPIDSTASHIRLLPGAQTIARSIVLCS